MSFFFSILNRKYFHYEKFELEIQSILQVMIDTLCHHSNDFHLENPYAWLICSPKKSFIVRANSDRERQEWLTHLDRCIRHASGGNNENQMLAPHWIPDDQAATCMHCHTTKFSAYNRRHVSDRERKMTINESN